MATSVAILPMDLSIPDNGDYSQAWALLDKTTGNSILDSTVQLKMDIKATLDDDAVPIISLVNQLSPTVTGFVLDPAIATNGQFQVTIRRSDLEPQIDAPATKVTLYYDMGVLYTDGFFIIYTAGKLVINMGVTSVP